MKRNLFSLLIVFATALGMEAGVTSSSAVGTTGDLQEIRPESDHAWVQVSPADLQVPGPQTIRLTRCEPGVTGSEPEYYIYISGTDSSEAARVTGGTCKGDGAPGTLQFITARSHASGYAISSASDGLQEALIASRFVPTHPTGRPQPTRVSVPPGELKAFARISIRVSGTTVDFSGSILECYMADSCIYVGDAVNSNNVSDVTLINPKGRPMVVNGTKPFIEVNGLKTRIFNVSTRVAPAGAFFSSYVQVDGDEAFLLDGLDTAPGLTTGSSGVRCDTVRCDPYVYAPGPFGANGDAVGWLKHLDITAQCTANGVDWQSGNTLRISDSVIQGYAQYGVRGGTARGGYGGIELDNVYEEVGNCGQNLKNPIGNVGEAGVIGQGSTVKIIGGEAPTGYLPVFASTGATDYRYYVIARHATYGPSAPLLVGKALTNGSGSINVTWPDITGAATWDLLRVTATSPEKAPYGTAAYAVGTGLVKAAICINGLCSYSDTQAALTSYTVPATSYFPMISYWPGNLVLGSSGDSGNTQAGPAHAILDRLTSSTVSVLGSTVPSISAFDCSTMSNYSPLWAVCINAGITGQAYLATVLGQTDAANNGPPANSKGRLNFGKMIPALPNHLITLADSAFDKTMATAGGRPANDANDVWIGFDGTVNQGITQAQLAFGAPKAISNYIGNVGDGSAWLERLTSSAKTFKVPVSTPQMVSTASTGTAPLVVSSKTPVTNLTVANHPVLQSCGAAEQCSATLVTSGQIVIGRITLRSGSATLSGINPAFAASTSFNCIANDLTNPANGVNAVPDSGNRVQFKGIGEDEISYQCAGK